MQINNRNVIPLVFAVDDNYAPFLGVALRSILNNASPKNFYKVYVLNTEISADNIERISSFSCDLMEIKFIDVASRMDKINRDKIHLRDYYTKAIYYRIFIPALFPQYDKILYVDCDVVLLRDIAEFYNADLGDNIFGAVHEETMSFMNVFGEYSEDFLGVDRMKYFNSGFLLINSKEYMKENIEEKFINLMHEHKFEVAPDQDYLNVLCKDRVKYFDIGWNKTPFNEIEYKEEDLKLVHFKLNFKPWHYHNVKFEKYFWKYAKETPYYETLLKMREDYGDQQKKNDDAAFIALQNTARKYIDSEDNYKKLQEKKGK